MYELCQYQELLYFLTWRDVKVRYKQTVLGAAWAVLQPSFIMVVFSLFFGRLARIPSDDITHPIFSYAALVPWEFFANALQHSSTSLVASAKSIRKVHFPRLVIPISAVLGGAIDFAIAFVVLLGMMLFVGTLPTWDVLWLPLLPLLALVTSLGVGLWLTALNVQFRDVGYAVPFIIQAWMFATLVAYPSSLLDEPWRTLYGINPMAGVVEGFSWALLGVDTAPGPIVRVSAALPIAILITGAYYVRRMEKTFANVVQSWTTDEGRQTNYEGQLMPFKFERLEVWKLALDYVVSVYDLAGRLAAKERYNLKSRVARAATSIALNIAEGSTGQNAEQARFLYLAIRSLLETVACQHLMSRPGYPSDPQPVRQLYGRSEILAHITDDRRCTHAGPRVYRPPSIVLL